MKRLPWIVSNAARQETHYIFEAQKGTTDFNDVQDKILINLERQNLWSIF